LWGVVVHTYNPNIWEVKTLSQKIQQKACNPSFLKGGYWEDCSLRAAWAKS
jgi:hypothetical protein